MQHRHGEQASSFPAPASREGSSSGSWGHYSLLTPGSFLLLVWEKLPADGSLLSKQELLGASDILAPLIQVPKGIQKSGCRAKLSRIKKGKTLKRKKKKPHCLSLAYFPHPPKKYSKNKNRKKHLSGFIILLCSAPRRFGQILCWTLSLAVA